MRLLAILMAVAAPASADPGIRAGGEAGHRLHIDVDAAFTYAYDQPLTALGFLVRGTGEVPVWNTRRGTGTMDIGLELGYQNQPYALFTPYLGDAESISGSDHRVNLWLSFGHTVHVLASRRLTLGVQAILGLTWFAEDAQLGNSREMISRSYHTEHDELAFAIRLKLGYRFSRYVGVRAHVEGFPLARGWASTGCCSLGVGLFVAVR